MSYTPTTWQTGDTITAEKMNKMEQGIVNSGGGTAIVGLTFDMESSKYICDKTAAEIAQLFASSESVSLATTSPEDSIYTFPPIVHFTYDNSYPEDFYFMMYVVASSGGITSFSANSASDYPFTTNPL